MGLPQDQGGGETAVWAPLDSQAQWWRLTQGWGRRMKFVLCGLFHLLPRDIPCPGLVGGYCGSGTLTSQRVSQVVLVVKNLPTNAGDPGSIPGLGRSPERGHGNPLSILAWRISMDRERNLVGYSPWDRKESDMTEAT